MANIGPDEFLQLSDSERTERTEALSTVGRARRLDIPVEDAADDLGVPMDRVRRWASDALEPTTGGRTRATPDDDLYRLRPMAADDGVGFVGVHGSREADDAYNIFSTQWDYIHGMASVDDLRRLPADFNGLPVVRDPRVLDRLARQGQFDIEEVYRAVIGS